MRFRSPTRNQRSEPPPRAGTSPARGARVHALAPAVLCIAVFDGAHLFYHAEDARDWLTGRVLIAVNDRADAARGAASPSAGCAIPDADEATGQSTT